MPSSISLTKIIRYLEGRPPCIALYQNQTSHSFCLTSCHSHSISWLIAGNTLCTRGTLRRDRWRATRSGNHGVRARTRGVTRDARAHSPPSPPDTKTLIFLLSSIQECARRRDTQNLIRSASWYCYRAENRISRDAACV